MKNVEERKGHLKEQLLDVKKYGLRVFLNISKDYVYGLMSDGINIIYVQLKDGDNLFTTVFEYVPSKKNGTGCLTCKEGYGYEKLTRDVFNEVVREGRNLAARYGAKLYENLEEFLRTRYNAETYEEL